MQEPALMDITIYQGASWDLFLTWTAGADPGVPVDLTGWMAEMQIRALAASRTALLTLTTSNDRIVLGGVEGTILLQLDAETTESLEQGVFVYDLELKAGNGGQVTRLLEGSVTVDPEVTRWH
jgi:hypothetical protein